jgi:hypothetical protein
MATYPVKSLLKDTDELHAHVKSIGNADRFRLSDSVLNDLNSCDQIFVASTNKSRAYQGRDHWLRTEVYGYTVGYQFVITQRPLTDDDGSELAEFIIDNLEFSSVVLHSRLITNSEVEYTPENYLLTQLKEYLAES